MTNGEVVQRFVDGQTGYGGNLFTDGKSIYSYGVEIARWGVREIEMVDPEEYYSRTTSRHRNMVRGQARASGIIVSE